MPEGVGVNYVITAPNGAEQAFTLTGSQFIENQRVTALRDGYKVQVSFPEGVLYSQSDPPEVTTGNDIIARTNLWSALGGQIELVPLPRLTTNEITLNWADNVQAIPDSAQLRIVQTGTVPIAYVLYETQADGTGLLLGEVLVRGDQETHPGFEILLIPNFTFDITKEYRLGVTFMDLNDAHEMTNLVTTHCSGSYENLTLNTSRIILTSISSQEPQIYVHHTLT